MTMVFVNKKETAEKIKKYLGENGLKTNILIGGMPQIERD